MLDVGTLHVGLVVDLSVIGFIFMLIMFSACSGFFRKRGSSGGMERYDTMEDLKREIGELKKQITQLEQSRRIK